MLHQVMQHIAAENNLAETAFFLENGQNFEIRWFTPIQEVELCGHATLATAHVLYNHLSYDSDPCVFQTTKRGNLSVSKGKEGLIMDFPADRPKQASATDKMLVEEILGLSLVDLLKGTDDYLAVVDDAKTILEFNPDFEGISRLNSRGIILTAANYRDYDFISRCFFPKYGIDEDPVTGSAHTLLTPYWAGKKDKSKLMALQASARTGNLICTLVADRVHLEGSAVTYLIGEIKVS